MPARLVALDEGSDIPLDRAMVVVGRHPQCDARLDSLRVSRHHCCMTRDKDEILVRDLGSTNGIRINGQRVESGRLRSGDELSIAHIRYRLEDNLAPEATLADVGGGRRFGTAGGEDSGRAPSSSEASPVVMPVLGGDNPLAAAVRDLLPSGMADRCRIQVIVQVQDPEAKPVSLPEQGVVCRPDSSP